MTTPTALQIYGLGIRFLRSGDDLSVVEHTLAPRSLGSGVHTHTREDEHTYVIEGEVAVQIDGKTTVAGPGTLVEKPKGVPHAFWNAGDAPARLLEVISPGGFEGFFAEIAPLFPANGEPDFEGFAAACERYGLDYDVDSDERLIVENGLAGLEEG